MNEAEELLEMRHTLGFGQLETDAAFLPSGAQPLVPTVISYMQSADSVAKTHFFGIVVIPLLSQLEKMVQTC